MKNDSTLYNFEKGYVEEELWQRQKKKLFR